VCQERTVLKFTQRQFVGISSEERLRLRPNLLQHWTTSMRASLGSISPTSREQLLIDMEQLAKEDAALDLADLMMIADLRLMELAAESRKAQLAKAR
jgi:hypothetical protein